MLKTLTMHLHLHLHALHIFDSFRFDTATPGDHFHFTMDVKSLYTVIPNDCGLQGLAYFLEKCVVKEPSTPTLTRLAELMLTLNLFSSTTNSIINWVELRWGVEWVQTMPAYLSDMWNNKSASSTQDSYHSFTRGTSMTLLGQRGAGGMNSRTLLTLFLTIGSTLSISIVFPARTLRFHSQVRPWCGALTRA